MAVKMMGVKNTVFPGGFFCD